MFGFGGSPPPEPPADEKMDTLKILLTSKLQRKVDDIGMQFSSVFDNMPIVPRPLPSGYQFITQTALLKEAKTAAPFYETGQATDVSQPLVVRKLNRLQVWFRKSIEYAVIHKRMSERNGLIMTIVTTISGLLSGANTVVIFFFGTASFVSILSGIAAALVAALTSWTKYARYEYLRENHALSGMQFSEVARDILNYYDKCSPEAAAKLMEDAAGMLALEPGLKEELQPSQSGSESGAGADTGSQEGTGSGSGMGQAIRSTNANKKAINKSTNEEIDPLNLEAQMLYRKTVEYRLAHGYFQRVNTFGNDASSLAVLIMATVSGLLLFMGTGFQNVCAALSLVITLTTAFSTFMGFSNKMETHAITQKAFGNLQRDLLTLLVATDHATAEEEFPILKEKFEKVRAEAPFLPVMGLIGSKNEDGDEVYTHITEPEEMLHALKMGPEQLESLVGKLPGADAAKAAAEKAEAAAADAEAKAMSVAADAQGIAAGVQAQAGAAQAQAGAAATSTQAGAMDAVPKPKIS